MKTSVTARLYVYLILPLSAAALLSCDAILNSSPSKTLTYELARHDVIYMRLQSPQSADIKRFDPSSGKSKTILEDIYPSGGMHVSDSGNFIAYMRQTEPSALDKEIFIYDVNRNKEIKVNTPEASPHSFIASWSPDNQKLLLTSLISSDDERTHRLLLLRSPDWEPEVIYTAEYGITGPAWHPDSRQFTFMVYHSSAAFSSATGMLASIDSAPAAITEGRSMLSNMQFSPDGRQVAFQELIDSTHYVSSIRLNDLRHIPRIQMREFRMPNTGGMPSIYGPHDASNRSIQWIPTNPNRILYYEYTEIAKVETGESLINMFELHRNASRNVIQARLRAMRPSVSPNGNIMLLHILDPADNQRNIVASDINGRIKRDIELDMINLMDFKLVPKNSTK